MRSGIRMLLGLALVAHGLGNAVLPLRGVDWVAAGSWSYALVLVYLMAIIGFVKVGLGILGVRPLAGDLTAMVLVAGLCSLAGQWWLGDPDLWAGMALSALLPVVTAVFLAVNGEASRFVTGGGIWPEMSPALRSSRGWRCRPRCGR